MDPSYFAKSIPQTPIRVPGNRRIVFDTYDGITGYAVIQDPDVAAQLDFLISKRIGGLRRISKDEFDEFVSKKSTTPSSNKRPWREEVKPNAYAAKTVGVDRVGQAGDKQPEPAKDVRPKTEPDEVAKTYKPKKRTKKAS